MLASNDEQNVFVWHVGTDAKPLAIPARWKRSPFYLRFSPDSRILAAVCLSECFLWQVDTGAAHRLDFMRGPEDKLVPDIKALSFSPDNRMVVTGHFTSIRLWEVASGQERWQLRSNGHGLAFTPDQKLLVSGGYDHAILLWDMQRLALNTKTREKLQPSDLKTLWISLGDSAHPAFVAQQRLVSAPPQTIAFLAEQLRRRPIDPQRLTDLITRLEGITILGAETAANELTQLGTLAEDRIRESLRRKPSDEVRVRLEGILRKIEASPELHRELRAIETLERIDTAESLSLLSDLAKDLPSRRLRQEAQESVTRLRKNAAGAK